MTEIQEVYQEDTSGRRYRTPIITKGGYTYKMPPIDEPTTISLKKPMTRDEFKGLSDSLKVIYITHLKEQYGCTATQIAKMLGYSSNYFSKKIVSALNLSGVFKRGGRVSKKQLAAWNKFLKNETEKPASSTSPKQTLKQESAPATMFCSCSFTLKGELKVSDIADRISAMVADGTQCSISIAIDALTDTKE